MPRNTKNQKKNKHFSSGRRVRPKYCKECNAFYVLVGGKKINTHVCGERVEHHYEKVGKAKGWKKGRE